jgi:hypothetical protein
MRSLQISEPMGRAKLHRAVAAQLQSEGHYGEAVVIVRHTGLGTLHIRQRRFPDAEVALDKAWAVANSAMNAFLLDRVNILTVRATLHARPGRCWRRKQISGRRFR